MTWLFVAATIAGALGLLGGLAAIVGLTLPRAHAVTREARLLAAPEVVWRAITDVDRYAEWRDDVSRVERLADPAGKPMWVEHGSSGRLALTVDRVEPPRLLVVRIADPTLPFGGTWTYDISPVGEGSLLTITERGEIYNPLFRFVARFVLGYERTLASYLASLEKHFAGGARAS